MEEWRHRVILISELCGYVLLFLNVSSICLGKGFAPLRCTCAVEAPQGCGWVAAVVLISLEQKPSNTADLDLP